MTRVDLHIKIEGINQHSPKFDQDSYTFYLDENSIFNTTCGYVNATDYDTYLDYGVIRYELNNGQNRYFLNSYFFCARKYLNHLKCSFFL